MKKSYWGIIAFALALVLFAVLSTQAIFHDVPEYLTIAKNIAGIQNVSLFIGHSVVYPALISLFLKIWPSLVMIKLVNCLWIFLMGLALLYFFKNKNAFLIFAFSPLTWYASIQTTPILPASFCMLMAYFFIKQEKTKHRLLYSGLFLGLSAAFYDPMLLVTVVFILVYFWDKKLNDVFKYAIAFAIGILPRLILDYWLFKMPFYSLIRYFGTNALISLGLNPSQKIPGFTLQIIILSLVAISPLLFRVYKLKLKENLKDILFLGIIFILLLFRASLLKYFMLISPIVILLLSGILSKKEIKWHCILSIPLIILLTWSFFGYNSDVSAQKDIRIIIQNYNVNYIIAEPYNANYIASFLWQNNPKIIWFEDYNASINNQTSWKTYDFQISHPRISLREDIHILAVFQRPENITYENSILVAEKMGNESSELFGFKLDRCYGSLCVYKIK